MITKEQALTFAHHWVEAWNTHDMDMIMGHYTDDFEMTSPKIVALAGVASGTLKGKQKVGEYWSNALKRVPDLHFDIIEVLTGIDAVAIYYKSSMGTNVVEWFHFNDQGKVYKAASCYS